jgi:hypothetical protein
MLDGGCTRHTSIDKDGVQRPAHLLIEYREFLRLSRALQERKQVEQSVAGAIAYNAPPPSPNPPENVVQQGHQAPHDPASRATTAGCRRRGVPATTRLRAHDPERAPDKQSPAKACTRGLSCQAHTTSYARIPELVRAPDRLRPVRPPTEDPAPWTPCLGPRSADRRFHL